jgi:hypothetical protein
MPLSSSPPETKSEILSLELVRDEPPRAKRGRPTTLTVRAFLKICHNIEHGFSIPNACQVESISYRSFRNRVSRSLRLQERLKEAEVIRQALRHEEALANIMASGARCWMSHAWYLERVWPEKYSLKVVEREPLVLESTTQPVRVIGLPAAEIEKFTGPEYRRLENGNVERVAGGMRIVYARIA